MLLALDDTDGPAGGCTTHLAAEVLDVLGADAIAGPPRLVRLNPANPYKTRGNAAVVLELSDELDPFATLETAFELVREHARVADDKGAGLVLFDRAPDEQWYWRGVQALVGLDEAREAIGDHAHMSLGNGRGLIGALCAAAWRPREPTWESIAYRRRDAWGTPRDVDASSIVAVAEAYSETFECHDPRTGHPVMVPRTACPVLYGLRASSPHRLDEACSQIRSEPVAQRQTFVSNQASDDHLTDDVLCWCVVADRPRSIRGGHVLAPLRTPEGERRTAVAFEPTGRLRRAVNGLREGDEVMALGTLTDEHAVHVEKMMVRPGPRRDRARCPSCSSAMASMGRDAPRRCRRCGHRASPSATTPEPFWAQADPSARRHLARPLSLGLAPRVADACKAVTTTLI